MILRSDCYFEWWGDWTSLNLQIPGSVLQKSSSFCHRNECCFLFSAGKNIIQATLFFLLPVIDYSDSLYMHAYVLVLFENISFSVSWFIALSFFTPCMRRLVSTSVHFSLQGHTAWTASLFVFSTYKLTIYCNLIFCIFILLWAIEILWTGLFDWSIEDCKTSIKEYLTSECTHPVLGVRCCF